MDSSTLLEEVNNSQTKLDPFQAQWYKFLTQDFERVLKDN